jgi:L-lactate dehydrogenase (cytochrome)
MNFARILSLQDFDRPARRRLPKSVYGFLVHGAEDSRTLRANRDAFATLQLRPRVLVDVSSCSQSTELFGRRYAAPFGIAPMGAAALYWFEAELAMARAAAAAGVPFILSAASSVPLERVIRVAPSAWYQAYIPGDHSVIAPLLDRVRIAGYEVLVVTADVPVGGNREDDMRLGITIPMQIGRQIALDGLRHPRWLLGTAAATLLRNGIPRFENMRAERGGSIINAPVAEHRSGRAGLAWSDIQWIRQVWRGKLVIKGILHPEDARRAALVGADGIIISNHGGRQLDSAAAPLHVLSSIIAMAGDMVVMMDGGIRRGTDVIKALALGAQFVFAGRPFMLAVAAAGEPAVRHAIKLLSAEIERDLALLGCPDVRNLDDSLLLPPTALSLPKDLAPLNVAYA